MNTPTRDRRRSGFTLIEMLAVMVILSILMAFLVTSLMGASETVELENTRQFIAQIGAAVDTYETDEGDYPPSSFPSGADRGSNKVNMGAEELVIALMKPGSEVWELPEDRLGNSDGDATRKSVTSFPKPDLFELTDFWDNPIAYIHRRDYEKPIIYLTFDPDTGESHEQPVSAYKSSKTGAFFNRRSFQLISAGPDGLFGTSDDIGNFEGDGE